MVDFINWGCRDFMSKIKNVEIRDNFCLHVDLENGSSILLNLESRLQTVRFGLLADKDFFKCVSTDGDFIRWGDQIEISINEIFQLAQK